MSSSNIDRDLINFSIAISSFSPPINQTMKAIALLWYENYKNDGAEKSSKELANIMQELRLSGSVNLSRLNDNLKRSVYTVKGRARNGFRIQLAKLIELDQKFEPCLTRKVVYVAYEVIPEEIAKGTRSYIEKLIWQLNGCYETGFYDGCAILCRRVIESLLITSFENNGQQSIIKINGKYKTLADIIALSKSGNYISLSRGVRNNIDVFKDVGDRAAHDKYYITTKDDIDDIKIKFRHAVNELLILSGIKS